MSDASSRRCPALKDGFAWYERLLARLALAGMVCVGAIGIYLKSPSAALAYLLFAAAGGLLVMYDFLCVYCPYPYEYSTCLFFPPQLLTGVVKPRSGNISPIRKALLLVITAGLILVPQYWLWRNWPLLAAFWILAAPIGLVFPLYFCPRCRHGQCAANRALGTAPRQASRSPEQGDAD